MYIGQYVLIIGLLSWPACMDCSEAENMWLDPSGWEGNSPSKICPVCEIVPDKGLATLFFYKKFISNIFNRSALKLNEQTGKFERTVLFSLTADQLEIIENPASVRDLNVVISSVLEAAKDTQSFNNTSNNDSSKIWFLELLANMLLQMVYYICQVLGVKLSCLVFTFILSSYFIYKRLEKNPVISIGLVLSHLAYLNYITNLAGFLSSMREGIKFSFDILSSRSDVRFLFFVCGVLLCIWFVHKRFNKNLIYAVGIVFFLFGYTCTYLQCNKNLEADKYIKYIANEKGFFEKWMPYLFKRTPIDVQIENVRENSKLDLDFCRPDHVLVMYANEFFISQLEIITKKICETSGHLYQTLPVPFCYLAPLAVPFLFVFLIGQFFSPASLLALKEYFSQSYRQGQHSNENHSSADKLSGDNLKHFLKVCSSQVENVVDKTGAIEDLPKSNQKTSQKSILGESKFNSSTIELDKIKENPSKTEISTIGDSSPESEVQNEEKTKKEN